MSKYYSVFCLLDIQCGFFAWLWRLTDLLSFSVFQSLTRFFFLFYMSKRFLKSQCYSMFRLLDHWCGIFELLYPAILNLAVIVNWILVLLFFSSVWQECHWIVTHSEGLQGVCLLNQLFWIFFFRVLFSKALPGDKNDFMIWKLFLLGISSPLGSVFWHI